MPFLATGTGVLCYAAQFFLGVTIFTFKPEELVAEKYFLWRRRQRVFLRQSIKAVKQVKDGGEGEDSFPSWGLSIIGDKAVGIISRQPMEKSDWLGPIVAEWAGVPFEPAEPAKRQDYEIL
jgi:hypothetical protein